jgi:hypothetical protein
MTCTAAHATIIVIMTKMEMARRCWPLYAGAIPTDSVETVKPPSSAVCVPTVLYRFSM